MLDSDAWPLVLSKLLFFFFATSDTQSAAGVTFALLGRGVFGASKASLTMSHGSLISSVVSFYIVSWCRNFSVKHRNKLTQPLRPVSQHNYWISNCYKLHLYILVFHCVATLPKWQISILGKVSKQLHSFFMS